MEAPSPAKRPFGLQATPVDAFLRTVGAELRAASEFLGRPLPSSPASRPPHPPTSASPWRRQPPPLLLASHWPSAPAPTGAPAQAPVPGDASDATESHSTIISDSSSGGSSGGKDGEVEELLGVLLQESGRPQPLPPAAVGDAAAGAPAEAATASAAAAAEQHPEEPAAEEPATQAAEMAPADQHAAAAEAPAERSAPPPPPAAQAAAPAAPAPRAAVPLHTGDSHSKVLSWLSSGGTDVTCETLLEAAPARPAAAAAAAAAPATQRPAAVQLLGASTRIPAWRPASPARPAPVAPPGPAPAQPACYARHAAPAWQHHTLAFARPACPACGLAEAGCGCAAAAAPLRLLRARQLGSPSPTRRGQQQRLGGGRSVDVAGMPPASGLPPRQRASASLPVPQQVQHRPGGISTGYIHTAFIGGERQQQQHTAAGAFAAPAPAAPGHAPAGMDARVHQLTAASASPPQLDMWAAYLASRQPADAALALPAPKGSGGAALAQLQSISQRIRSMQGSISSFLLQQRACPTAAGAAGAGQPASQPSRQAQPRAPTQASPPPAAAAGAPLPGQPPSRAGTLQQYAASSQQQQQQQQAELFTDDFVLAMQTGVDWRSVQQAAPACAAPGGKSGSGGNGSGGAGSASPARQSAAVQRLKEVQQQQRVVTAVRVGRAVAAGRRSSSVA